MRKQRKLPSHAQFQLTVCLGYWAYQKADITAISEGSSAIDR